MEGGKVGENESKDERKENKINRKKRKAKTTQWCLRSEGAMIQRLCDLPQITQFAGYKA